MQNLHLEGGVREEEEAVEKDLPDNVYLGNNCGLYENKIIRE